MNSHVYKFNGETKQQKEGGAIGLEMTGEIAGVFMQWLDKQMNMKLEENGIQIKMYKRRFTKQSFKGLNQIIFFSKSHFVVGCASV